MKFFTKAVILFSLVFFASCSTRNKSEGIEANSLKAISSKKEEDLKWTVELEKKRLTSRIDHFDFISDTLELSPETFMAFEAGHPQTPVYPELNGLGSLDISDLDKSAAAVVSSFCRAYFSDSQEGVETFMNDSSMYALVLFDYDLKQIGFANYAEKWIFAKPFVSEDVLQIPVRISGNNIQADVLFYMTNITKNESQQWKIQDIMIYNYQGEGGS